jgi:protein TonB
MAVSTSSAAIFSPRAQNRALALCVLASLVLHALVLLLPGLRPGGSAPAGTRILTATFAPRVAAGEPRPAVPEVTKRVEPEPVRPKPEARPQPETPRPVISTPLPGPGPGPAVARAAEVAAAPALPDEPFAAAPAGSASGASAARRGEARPAAASPGAGSTRSGSGADTGTLDQYRLALIGVARRYKRYPAQAMDKGWQGRVEIRLVVGANGAIQSSLVKASSGYEILDNQALDMVNKAKPLTPIPAALWGREFTVDIPVIFDLQAG